MMHRPVESTEFQRPPREPQVIVRYDLIGLHVVDTDGGQVVCRAVPVDPGVATGARLRPIPLVETVVARAKTIEKWIAELDRKSDV